MDMIRHPAKFSDAVLEKIVPFLSDGLILDPFAGVGKLSSIAPKAIYNEIEYEWAHECPRVFAVVGDALVLPFADRTFDQAVSSCTYGNRMADHFTDHKPEKNYRRNTYTHTLGRKLHPHNSGQLQWGKAYRRFHFHAWTELRRVLKPKATFILNVSDHIRNKERQYVSQFHALTLMKLGFNQIWCGRVSTPRNGFGENRELRVEYENIFIYRLEK